MIAGTVMTALGFHGGVGGARKPKLPAGNFGNVETTRVHYIERGRGTQLVLLRG